MDQAVQLKGRTGSRIWRWSKRGLLGLLVVVVTASIAGFTYQTIAEALDRRAYPAPGELIDIGGRRMHIQCAGAGSPVVILEAGLGGFSPDWSWVQDKVSDDTRVCAYDRAGAGWSDAGPRPRDAAAIAADLHALLAAAGVPGPYLLAGHSYGGLYVRAFAAEFPDEVAGVVFIDSSHPDQWTRLPSGESQFTKFHWIYRLARAAVRIGLLRVTNFIPLDTDLPPQQAAERRALSNTSDFVEAAADEFDASAATTATVNAARNLGDRPLYVVTAGLRPEGEADLARLWLSLQDELATLSTNSAHDIVAGGTHTSLLTKADDAEDTSAAILAVVEAVRNGGRLMPKAAKAGE